MCVSNYSPRKVLTTVYPLQVTKIEAREDIVNGKCYCGTPKCIGTLFPRIIRGGQESGDEGGNEGEAHDEGGRNEGSEEAGGKGDEQNAAEEVETGAAVDMHMDI